TTIAGATVGVLVLAAVALGIALWVTLRRWILEPLDALATDARAVSSGDLLHPVETVGPGEIAALAGDVERMRVALVDQLQVLQASRTELETAHDLLTEQTEELRRS